MTFDIIGSSEGHASGIPVPAHFHKKDSLSCISVELSHNVYSLKAGLPPVRTRVESLKTIEDDLDSHLTSKKELNAGAVDYVRSESYEMIQELKLLTMGISQSRMDSMNLYESLLETHMRLCQLQRRRETLSDIVRIVQLLEFSSRLLSSVTRRNVQLYADAIMCALAQVPNSILAKGSIRWHLAHRLAQARESLVLDIIECAILNKSLIDQYGESGPDEIIAIWDDLDHASSRLRLSCVSFIASHLKSIMHEENFPDQLVSWFNRLSEMSTLFPLLSHGWVQYASHLIFEVVGICIYKLSSSPATPELPSTDSEIPFDVLFEIHQHLVENPSSRRFSRQALDIPECVGDPIKLMHGLKQSIPKVPSGLKPAELMWIYDLEWLVYCSCVRSTVLLNITEHIQSLVIGETNASHACAIVDAMKEFVNAPERASMDPSLINTALQSVVASTIISSVCDYMEARTSAEIDSMIPQWGEKFADLYSRISRACERRSLTGQRGVTFKTVFEYLGLMTQTDSHVVQSWCIAHKAVLPARFINNLIHHVSGDEYQNDVLEVNALILNCIKVD